MTLAKNLKFNFNHKEQIDRLYEIMTSEQIKVAFDSRGEDLQQFIYKIIDTLSSTNAESGATNIGVSAQNGIISTNVQAALEELQKRLESIVVGEIPDDLFIKLILSAKEPVEKNNVYWLQEVDSNFNLGTVGDDKEIRFEEIKEG